MKSARRKAYIAKKNKKEKKGFSPLKILIPLALVILFGIFLSLSTKAWDGTNKVSIVMPREGGEVAVTVFDPKLVEITTFLIPADTEVNVARNYGTFRIKNIWQLGENEKIGGALLAETVTQNFLFPVHLFAGGSTYWDSGTLKDSLRFVLSPGRTNVGFGDRLKIAAFSLKVNELGRSSIDLAKSQYLAKRTLKDGLPGYIIEGPISQRLTSYFADTQIGELNVKINIIDATGTPGVATKLGEILQTLGGKVVSVDKKTVPEETDCSISGKYKDVVAKIAELFSCSVENEDADFDLDIKIGNNFAKRF